MTKSSRSRYDDIWPRLEILFKGVLLNPDNSCETTEFQEEVYNDVQTLIINNEERQLYVDLKALLEVHLESNVMFVYCQSVDLAGFPFIYFSFPFCRSALKYWKKSISLLSFQLLMSLGGNSAVLLLRFAMSWATFMITSRRCQPWKTKRLLLTCVLSACLKDWFVVLTCI